MTVSLQYGGRVAALPVEAVSQHLATASRADLAVLLAVSADPGQSVSALSECTGEPESEVLASLSRWQKAGVLTVSLAAGEALPDAALPEGKKRKLLQTASLPSYSTEETARILEGGEGISGLIDACQQIMGKMFSTSEISVMLGLVDYLSLEPDYILLLCNHCVERGKRSMRYVEKTALSLYDEGVTGYRALEEYFRLSDARESAEGQIRTLFGLGSRSLTKKEKDFLTNWTGVWNFGMDVIEKAYETAVNTTGGKASLPYVNRVLENWHAAGCRTLTDVEAAQDAHRREKEAAGSTFDTDDFFEAALRRSYGESTPPANAGKT